MGEVNIIDKSMFWDMKDTLSYNAYFNFIIGSRRTGKTYGCKKYVIEEYLKSGKQFVWVRRFDSEFDDFNTKTGKDSFFSDVKKEFPEHKFEYKNYCFYVDDKAMGYAIPLTVSMKKKSSDFSSVHIIIFDEYIIESGTSYYLKNEVQIFMNLVLTVLSYRDGVKGAFLLANSITFYNPYTWYFNLQKPRNNKNIWRNDEYLVQIVKNQKFIDHVKTTRLGKIIDGTEMGNFSIDAEFIRDSEDFVLKETPKKLRYYFTIKNVQDYYGVWINESVMYVSSKYDPSYKLIFVTKLDNHQPNTMLLKGNRSVLFESFVKTFKMGDVYFDSIKTKNIVLETIKHTL